MPTLADPLVLGAAAVAAVLGCALLAHAWVQGRALRARLAAGGDSAFDPATGCFSPAAAPHRIRAEAGRARRAGAPLALAIAEHDDRAVLEQAAHELQRLAPARTSAIRLSASRIALLGTVTPDALAPALDGRLDWQVSLLEPGDDLAERTISQALPDPVAAGEAA